MIAQSGGSVTLRRFIMRQKNDPSASEVEVLYRQTAQVVFKLAFVHASRVKGAREILKKTYLYLAANPMAFAAAQEDPVLVYQTADRFCRQFYQEKLRRKMKRGDFEEMQLPFPSDNLLPVLQLPAACKSAFVLTALAFSPEQIAVILSISPEQLEKQLAAADHFLAGGKSPVSRETALLAVTRAEPDPAFYRRQSDSISVAMAERGFRPVQRLKSAKRWLDSHVFYIALLLLLIFVLAYLGVEYHWF